MLGRLPYEALSQGGQSDHSREDRKLLEVDIHPDFRTLMEHKAFLSTWCKTFMHTREKEVFFLNTLKISLAPIHQEGLFQVMFVVTQQQKLNTRERKGQDATKITSAFADSCIQFLWSAMPMTALTWMVKNIPNRTTIGDFTEEIDEAGFVRQYNFFHLLMRMLCLCLALMNLLHSVALSSLSLVTMALIIPHWVVNSDRLSPEEARFREDYCFEALAFSRHTIDLEFDEETMRPEKAIEAPRNAGIDPSTMKMKQFYQKHNRVSDQKAPTGTNRASYHAREPIEDDDERLAMRKGDMAPPVPERVANPRIRKDRAVQEFRQNSETLHRATSEDAYTKAWFDYCRSIFPQSVRKAGPDVDLHNVSTYQCRHPLQQHGFLQQED